MLRSARKARGEAHRQEATFVEGNAEALPSPKLFDAYTIAFGIRNVPRIDQALAEAWRVLKRGGQFFCLEFSQVDTPVLDRSTKPIPFPRSRHGKVVPGDGESYRYLVNRSVSSRPERFADISARRFRARRFTLSGGVVAIHSGWKL